jgi:hypothetical protein
MGFGLVIGFIGLLQLVTTGNYNALANSRTLQFTTARTKSYPFVFTSGCLVTDPNNVLFCSRLYRLATVSQVTHGSKCCRHILGYNCDSQLVLNWPLTGYLWLTLLAALTWLSALTSQYVRSSSPFKQISFVLTLQKSWKKV